MFEFFDSITEFFTVDLYTFVQESAAWFLIKFMESKLSFMMWMVQFSWGVASSVLDQLMISEQLAVVWNAADSQLTAWLTFFRLPEAINMIATAGVTKMILRMLKIA